MSQVFPKPRTFEAETVDRLSQAAVADHASAVADPRDVTSDQLVVESLDEEGWPTSPATAPLTRAALGGG